MRRTKTTLAKAVFIVALTIAMGSIRTWAQHAGHGGIAPQPTPSAWFGKVKGKVVELSQSTIAVEKPKKNKTEKLVILIDGRTEVKGDVEIGADVVVKYREEFGSKTATQIEVKKPKQTEGSEGRR